MGIDRFALDFGYGIRILNQSPMESIISFIISANNNIPRIKSLIEKLCEGYGSYLDGYYAFPTLEQLNSVSLTWFKEHGFGYRSEYLVSTIQKLKSLDLNYISSLSTSSAKVELLKLKGIGNKVADCVLLFGFHKTDVFPTDTWIIQMYESSHHDTAKSPKQISEYYLRKFGEMAGYAQQYLFYAKRENSFKGD